MQRLAPQNTPQSEFHFRAGMLAGLGGGLAEFVWVIAFCAANDMDSSAVVCGVTAAVLPEYADSALAPATGVFIHFLLSALLGVAFAVIFSRVIASAAKSAATMLIAITTLGVIWTINFFLILPLLSPEFVTILPLGVTLTSKLLFGIGMALVLNSNFATRGKISFIPYFLASGTAGRLS